MANQINLVSQDQTGCAVNLMLFYIYFEFDFPLWFGCFIKSILFDHSRIMDKLNPFFPERKLLENAGIRQ